MKRTLYPKLLAGYLMYGLIGFVIIATFTYHLTFNFLQRKEAASLYRVDHPRGTAKAADDPKYLLIR